ncbi:NAD(P)/FAD-dependent oxidoreductase [Marinobacterium arenosum]|uniref:NAD(P)/FAD-dependent oxidoreductase n=1 Tax=Marinobacterium arenosum TaxID=2862496 RepID=UPI001C94A9A0|nr:NAD(P)/FAD-dependent oxidoreductase [Marinobacterium arenosum]MBY4676118.1 tryptophan 7-halogenase [Marinobacterium arenosum]
MVKVQGCFDIVVIGAGPSGAVASALLNKKGYQVLVLEKEHFPRFSIGESLLPQSMEYLEQAGMLPAIEDAAFQFKNGAAFTCGELYDFFDFREKFSPGWGTTFQVQRDLFDKVLADEAEKQGVEIRYGHAVTAYQSDAQKASLCVESDEGDVYQVEAKFVLDGSGFGRVLPRLLDLQCPSNLASRTSLFTHIKDNISDDRFDRNKILITVHPLHRDIWYWLIPFSNGRSSVGVVAPREFLADMQGDSESKLRALIGQGEMLADVLDDAELDTRVGRIEGYSCDVKQLYGDRFALLGNAGEFLDPVFSSGVTIALKSASLAANVVDAQLAGRSPDWDQEYAHPLKRGVDTFREFVEGWYDGRLQDVIFARDKRDEVKRMICSILAGYAWDLNNPYVKSPSRLNTLAELCRR